MATKMIFSLSFNREPFIYQETKFWIIQLVWRMAVNFCLRSFQVGKTKSCFHFCTKRLKQSLICSMSLYIIMLFFLFLSSISNTIHLKSLNSEFRCTCWAYNKVYTLVPLLSIFYFCPLFLFYSISAHCLKYTLPRVN